MRSIELTSSALRLELVTVGASVRRLQVVEPDGALVDVVLGHRDPEQYARDGGYLGAIAGRVANRIDQGRFTLDGVEHQVPALDRGNALHGGELGFDRIEWEVADEGPGHAVLSLTSAGGDQGFPGELTAYATYRLDGDRVTIALEATTTAPTVVNLTNHAFFNLDGETSTDIEDHALQVPAEGWLPTRADQIPTGEIAATEGSAFDLREPRRLGDVHAQTSDQLTVAGGIDHHFVVPGEGMRRLALLAGASGRTLEVLSDQRGVQVYTGAHFDGSDVGLGGEPIGHRAGIALETQGFPDAPNHNGFPSVTLRPGETYRSTTVWRLGRA